MTFFMFGFFRFYLSAMLPLPPLLLYQNTDLSVSLLVLLSATAGMSRNNVNAGIAGMLR
jgi:hypothetical protein